MPEDALAAVVRQVLSTRGPMSEDDLLDVLEADGADLGPDPVEALDDILDDDEPILPLADGRWAWIPALLEGRIFTHRLTEVEVDHDLLAWGPDLAPVSILTEVEAYRRLADGSPLSDVFPFLHDEVLAARGVPADAVDFSGALLLPSGHLAALGVRAGDLVGLGVGASGLELVAVAEPVAEPVAGHPGEALAALLGERPDRPEMLDIATWTVCADDDSLFREPTAPLGDLLAASGLARDGDRVACGGFDFAAARTADRLETIKARYELDDDEALAVLATLTLHEQTLDVVEAVQARLDDGDEPDVTDIAPAPVAGEPSSEPDRTTVRTVLELLGEPAVAAAVLREIDVDDETSAMALGVFAESAEPMAPRAARPALRWMRAKAHEALGDVEQAEAALNDAESLDPSWPLTLLELARYAGDRGDAERGLSLLRRAGAPPDDHLQQLLEAFRAAPRADLGRNQRCWCGSGRKYKVCHLNREQLPLEERAAWLYQKAAIDLLDGPFMAEFLEIARVRSQHWDSPDSLVDGLRDPLVADVVLFEGGAFAEFVGTRGVLLPDDEQSLAQQWLLVQRSVYEVLDVSRGQGFTVRDVRTGDVHEVRERAASTQVKAGEFYCARVVPAGETMQVFGGLEPVSLGERDGLIALLDDEPDPVELVAALSRRFAPPVLLNTEGEPLTMCDAVLRAADPEALARGLDGLYEREEGESGDTLVWFEHVVTHGMQRVRAHLELTGDELHVHANSAERFDRVLAAVRALDASVSVLSETREPLGDLRDAQRLAGDDAESEVIDDVAADPALAAALQDMIHMYEAAWLDESLPALAGHTPRQCADDPTRRPDLIRLLDSFPPDTGRPGAMSPARLREALGLD
ncbi:SEC-C metal-binding domain-containing protein [Mycobacterium sp. Lab-001]|uniref:SEC-C metal-binding domain-containing protein n=1 Tax=Mycobacterium sp. Lab-001 TaxID=3410136 RepID=UPI003D16419C